MPAKTKRADFLIAQMNGAYGMASKVTPIKQIIPKLNLINVKPSKKPSVEKLGQKQQLLYKSNYNSLSKKLISERKSV